LVAELRFVTTSHGAKIAYTVEGSGPTVIVTPSTLLQDPVDQRPAWSGMSHYARKIEYDAAGSGHSSRDRFDFSFQGLLAELEAVADAATVDAPFVLIGEYAGGPVAIRFAVEHPDWVERLVLHNSWSSGLEPTTRPGWAEYRRLLEGDWQNATEVAARVATEATGEAASRYAKSIAANVDQRTYLKFLDAVAEHDASALLPLVGVPTFVVYDPHTSFPYDQSSRRLATAIPGARLATVPTPWDFEHFTPVFEQWVLGEDDASSSAGSAAPPDGLAAPPSEVEFTGRELDVLRRVAVGMTNPQIAEELSVAQSTVARHVHNILAKTGLSNRTQLGAYAHRMGLV
jgi:DNA-binding CsgD family transcriptional regulator/pimeloyl-ACP methyl ester carboxylesterase